MSSKWTKKYKAEYMQKWYAKNETYRSEYKKKHRKKLNKQARTRYQKNRNKELKRIRKWHAANKGYRMKKPASWRTEQEMRYRYKIDIFTYKTALRIQKYTCAVCPRKFTKKYGKYPPNIDHCHKTGIVRGILCRRCNLVLGQINDSIQHAQNLIKYLKGEL